MRHVAEKLNSGDHVGFFYRNRQEQFALIIPFIKAGLARNERCVFISGDTPRALILQALEEAGVATGEAEARAQLVLTTPEQSYLQHGIFDPQKMVDALAAEVQQTARLGFSAFRATGELSWAAAVPAALMRLYEYERLFDALLHPSFLAVCQYDESVFSPELISQMLRVHPKVITRGRLWENPFYVELDHWSAPGHPTVTLDELMRSGRAAAMAD